MFFSPRVKSENLLINHCSVLANTDIKIKITLAVAITSLNQQSGTKSLTPIKFLVKQRKNNNIFCVSTEEQMGQMLPEREIQTVAKI